MSPATITKQSIPQPEIPAFLTSYDPSDLPGFSIDPLGFERGYLFLADKILPGLTNVASRPRYFSVLCAGAFLAEVDIADSPRIQYETRLASILRLERFWALANVLASQGSFGDDSPLFGVRGYRYVIRKLESLRRSGSQRTDATFPLLSRQIPYGVVGIYGAVADGMRLIDRRTLTPTPDLGEVLGDAFVRETAAPQSLIKAVRNDGNFSVSQLTEWGTRSHIAGQTGEVERKCLSEALRRDPVRSRMANLLAKHPFQGNDDTELRRLSRLRHVLAGSCEDRDLHEAVGVIVDFEAAYRLVMLGFERLLRLCRTLPSAAIKPGDIKADGVIERVCRDLPTASAKLCAALDSTVTERFRQDLQRLEDTRRFLERASNACVSPTSLARELMDRHSDIQRGKFDRGRRKMPWLERIGDRISLTMTRVGGLDREAMTPEAIAAHPYRLSSADALNQAGSMV